MTPGQPDQAQLDPLALSGQAWLLWELSAGCSEGGSRAPQAREKRLLLSKLFSRVLAGASCPHSGVCRWGWGEQSGLCRHTMGHG